MTGFGRAEGKVGSSQFTIEVKSVNHRYLETRFRLPAALSSCENQCSEILRSRFERGAFEINIKHRYAPSGGTLTAGTRFIVDEMAARTLLEGAEWVRSELKLSDKPSLEFLAATNRVFIPVEEPEGAETLWAGVKPIYEQALNELSKMRDVEGTKLKKILKEGVDTLNKIVQALTLLAPEQPKRIQERLKSRVAQWAIAPSDPQRLEMEIAFLAERADVTEELDRLKTHCTAFLKHLDASQSVGRKLDFLTQELHREVNTLGAKAALIEMTQLTVEGKTAVEKLREQVQNVE